MIDTDEAPDIEIKHSLRSELVNLFEEELVNAVSQCLPRFNHGDVAPEYRVAVAKWFIEYAGSPGKYEGKQQYRTPDQARLDRALTQVGQLYDRDSSNIQIRCTEIYDGENKTEQLREDLIQVEQEYWENKGG